jgi:hypothetical protein
MPAILEHLLALGAVALTWLGAFRGASEQIPLALWFNPLNLLSSNLEIYECTPGYRHIHNQSLAIPGFPLAA